MSIASAPEPLPVAPPMEFNLKDYLDVVRRRKAVFFQTFALVLAVGIVTTLLSKPVYRTAAKIVVPQSSNDLNITNTQDPFATIMGRVNPDPVTTQLQILQSGPFLADARERAQVGSDPSVIPPSVQVEAIDLANTIGVVVEGGSPQEIQRYCKAIVDLHRERQLDASGGNVDKAIVFTRARRDEAFRALTSAEKKLVQFRRANRVEEMARLRESQAKERLDQESRMRQAESNMILAQAKVTDLRARLEREPKQLVEETIKENPRYAKLQDRIDDLNFQRSEAAKLYRPNSRQMLELDKQISDLQTQLEATPQQVTSKAISTNPLRAQIQLQLGTAEETLLGHQQDYNGAVARLKSINQITDDGTNEIILSRYNREREMAQAQYQNLTEKLNNLEMRKQAGTTTVRIIEPPGLPTVPVRPQKASNIALAFILAVFLGAGMAFLQEYLDDRVNAPEDVERLSSLPTLGHVPMMDGEAPKLVSEMAANSHIAEAYRALRSGIGFAALDAPIRRLQVTSASKGEGKSTTAANLAMAMAMDGKRIILVDSDLRRPSVHRIFNMSSTPGLSEVLVGMKTLEEALQPTEVSNLRVLCAGPIPPNPAELLGSAAFDRVIEQLEEMADVVVFDTPPCMPVTDPLLISSRMDGVVLVLQVGQTRKAAVKHIVQQLNRARARVIGVVFNRVQARKGGSYYYQYYYYAGDGYYAETADRGERHRRNGKRKRSELGSGKAVATLSRADENGDDA